MKDNYNKLKDILENIPFGMYVKSVDNKIIYINKKIVKMNLLLKVIIAYIKQKNGKINLYFMMKLPQSEKMLI